MNPIVVWLLAAAGAVGALALVWLFAMMPRLPGKRPPMMEALRRFDYAHRGLHERDQSVPENSLTAFERAAEAGFGIELDVQLTADGETVVFHDETLERICGDPRRVGELTYSQLCGLALPGTGETIPLFAEVLEQVAGRVPLIVEVKYYSRQRELCEKTWELLAGYAGAWCVESFSPEVVRWFRREHPSAVRGQLMMDNRKALGRVLAFFARNLFSNVLTRPDFMAYRYEDRGNISLRVCKKIYGVQEVSWTLTRPEQARRVKAEGGLIIFQYFDPRE